MYVHEQLEHYVHVQKKRETVQTYVTITYIEHHSV